MLPILKFSLLNLVARMRTGLKLIRHQIMLKRNWDTAAGLWLVEKKRQYFASNFIMLPRPGLGLQEIDSETEMHVDSWSVLWGIASVREWGQDRADAAEVSGIPMGLPGEASPMEARE